MYASIRRYTTEHGPEVTRLARRQFTHTLRQAPGLVAYYVVESADGKTWTSVSVFESRQAAEQSARLAADFIVREGAADLLGEPDVTVGEVVINVP